MMIDLSNITFLVVDDNPNVRKIVKSILHALGGRVIKEAGDGTEAFDVLKSFRADIIIVDWMMKPMNGLEFTRRIRTDKNSLNISIPIIMISGHTEIDKIHEARDAGVTEFLAKPLSPEKLYQRIAGIILKPRQFVRTKSFFGPDRHRHSDEGFEGKRRRSSDVDEGMENVEKLIS